MGNYRKLFYAMHFVPYLVFPELLFGLFDDIFYYNWATLFLREINTGSWPSRLGESQK
jgi:hypothetical protein